MDTATAHADLASLDFAMHNAPGLLDFEPRECRIGLEEVRYQVALEGDTIEVKLLDCGPHDRTEAQKLVRWVIASATDEVKGCTAAYARLLQARLDEGASIVWL